MSNRWCRWGRRSAARADCVRRLLVSVVHAPTRGAARECVVCGQEHLSVMRDGVGDMTQLAEESRDARGVAWLADGWQDIRYGARLMRRTPGFAAAAILTIALGIGATTAMFSVVYGVILQPLPYRDPDRLVNLWSTAIKRGLPRANNGMANVYD